MPTFRGIDHFALTVTDLEASHRFYTEVLGFVAVLDFSGIGRGYIHSPSGFTLALVVHPAAPGGRFSELATGVDHLGLAAANLDELREWERRFRELGVEFTPIREADTGYHLNFRDPDGIALEFTVSNEPFAQALAMARERELTAVEIIEVAGRIFGPDHIYQG